MQCLSTGFFVEAITLSIVNKIKSRRDEVEIKADSVAAATK